MITRRARLQMQPGDLYVPVTFPAAALTDAGRELRGAMVDNAINALRDLMREQPTAWFRSGRLVVVTVEREIPHDQKDHVGLSSEE